MTVQINRFCYSPMGTFGTLTVGNLTLLTVEPPWADNKVSESCVPEGKYALSERESRVVWQTTRGEFPAGWELAEAPNRSYIMFHVGNTKRSTEGCVCVGQKLGVVAGKWAVMESMLAYRKLDKAIRANGSDKVIVTNIFGGTNDESNETGSNSGSGGDLLGMRDGGQAGGKSRRKSR